MRFTGSVFRLTNLFSVEKGKLINRFVCLQCFNKLTEKVFLFWCERRWGFQTSAFQLFEN